jgi:hypothetical protein
MMEIAESASQQEIGRNKVPAKFEQGGFTSGRREGPQTLFPGTSPGNLHRQGRRQKLAASKRMLKMEHFSADYHPEFLLARLQKLQRFETRRCRNWRSNPVRLRIS